MPLTASIQHLISNFLDEGNLSSFLIITSLIMKRDLSLFCTEEETNECSASTVSIAVVIQSDYRIFGLFCVTLAARR